MNMKRHYQIALALTVCAGAVLAATELAAYKRPELMGTRIVRASDLRTLESEEGQMQLYFQAPTSTLLNLGLRSMTLSPGATPHPTRPHSQRTESLLVVQDGVLDVTLEEDGSEVERLEPGAALFLAPNQWHRLTNSGTEPVTFLEMAWTSPGMNGEPEYPESVVNWGRGRRGQP